MTHPESIIEIYTDGACRGNPGPGGWGAVIFEGGHERHVYGGEAHTTNNRMELTAAIEALQALQRRERVVLTTDSQYLRQGITQWMSSWKRSGWKTSAKKEVKNKDLWMKLDVICREQDIRWEWVRGHTGHPHNELADRLANRGLEQLLRRSKES